MKKHKNKFYIILSLSLLLIVIFFVIPNLNKEVNKINPLLSLDSKNINTESATILAGSSKIHISFSPNTLFYDALLQARETGKIIFSGKNYPGLGFFVTDIGTLHTSSGKNMLYYINGKEATVGVSSYKLKDGDIIEWKLE